MAIELLPCPFCVGPIHKHRAGDVEGCVHIGEPHCPVESYRVMTIEQWNTRRLEPQSSDDVGVAGSLMVKSQIMAALGFYRDDMSAEAVKAFQDIARSRSEQDIEE